MRDPNTPLSSLQSFRKGHHTRWKFYENFPKDLWKIFQRNSWRNFWRNLFFLRIAVVGTRCYNCFMKSCWWFPERMLVRFLKNSMHKLLSFSRGILRDISECSCNENSEANLEAIHGRCSYSTFKRNPWIRKKYIQSFSKIPWKIFWRISGRISGGISSKNMNFW